MLLSYLIVRDALRDVPDGTWRSLLKLAITGIIALLTVPYDLGAHAGAWLARRVNPAAPKWTPNVATMALSIFFSLLFFSSGRNFFWIFVIMAALGVIGGTIFSLTLGYVEARTRRDGS